MRVVLLDFDGTCYQGDLPVQAYARRVAELLDPEQATFVIGAMRAFLEGKPAPAGTPVEFGTAEDGYELVRALAQQTGVDDHDRPGRAPPLPATPSFWQPLPGAKRARQPEPRRA